MDLEKEERRRDRKVKRMKVKMFVDSHLTWSTLGVLSAWSFETRILTMLSKNIKLIFEKKVLDIFCLVLLKTHGISDQHRGGDEIEEVRRL